MHSPIITLTTDFGTHGPYVASMKGAILSVNPAAAIVDVSHEIAPQNVRAGALCIASVSRYFPAGSIHVVVVDPGVGSSRRLLCASMHGQLFLAPDNGVLSRCAAEAVGANVVALTESRYWRDPVSATFHGRDVLAPVAAHLSLGVPPQQLGPPVHDWVDLPWTAPVRSGPELAGEVIAIDHFGNLITNISRMNLPAPEASGARVMCGGTHIGHVFRTYSDVAEFELVALIGSTDLLEIAVRNGNAAQRLGAEVGTAVVVRLAEL
jgi:S-adenosylmethionine hydrolase